MSLGPVMVDIEDISLSQEESEMLQHPLVGGVVLFSRNYESITQLEALCAEIHTLRQPHLLIAVDHEGGRVQRFREGFTRLPAVARLGEVYRQDQKLACRYAESTGWLMASELRAVGVDLSFAPVLDLDRGISSIIGDRAFHQVPDTVAILAHEYMNGMRRAGMQATGKHFPGHGSVKADSHIDLPVDTRRYEDIYTEDILPFERMFHYGLAGVMMAHVVYPEIENIPAGFSKHWVSDILRKRLDFRGVIFSDDLDMAGAESVGGCVERADAAINAGCDMILICNNSEGRNEILDGLLYNDDPVSHLRMVRMHGKQATSRDQLTKDPQWQQARAMVEEYEPSPLLDMDIE